MTEKDVFGWLAEVLHPGKDDKDLVSLGMVEEVKVEPGRVVVTLAFGKRPDPLKNYLEGAVRAAIYRNAPGGTDVEVKTVVKEAPKPKKPALDLNLDQVNEVSHIIGIASGKGGVGKSTVAVNLAIALARLGYRVGLADADVYGPSVPIMTATEELQPEAEPGEEEGKELFIPIEKYGVKWMSIGYFAQPGQALIWRGPMACSALKQMILQVKWGPLDYLLIDMPPGTGDIHISLVNDIGPSSAWWRTWPGSRRKSTRTRSTISSARAAAPKWPAASASTCSARFPSYSPSAKPATRANPSPWAPGPTPSRSWNSRGNWSMR